MKKTAQFLRNNLFPIALVLVTVFIAYQNYTPGTFLTGWDTLHPEFNFGLYWKRIISGVWQEHQGLGAVASQAHAAEIPRIIILQFFSLFLKVNQIRYAYAFLMLILGPLGVYFFLKYILPKESYTKSVSFIGALLYLLNLSTLQHFYVPLEMFLTQFAYIGWLLLFTIKYLDTGSKKSLIVFAVLNLLAAPQAHTSTLFIAYFMFLVTFLLARIFIKPTFKLAKKSFVIVLITLLINSFWLLPNIYFILERGDDVANSKIHSLFSDEAFLQNQQYGDIKDTAILRNFLFNWGEHTGNGNFGDLMDEWIEHQDRFLVLPIGYLVFIGYIVGGIVSTFKGRKGAFAIFASSFIGLFFIMNTNPPFGAVFKFFQAYIPLFEEAFRFPFTKFSTILAFGYATLFAFFIFEALDFARNKLVPKKYKLTVFLTPVIITILFIYYMFPVFTGHLISPSMRVDIPQRYFEMFDYFDDKKEYGRIADFPIHSFWGWSYYNWDGETNRGYQGAGFLWFGIKQPLLNREFDRWDPENEQYYREMSYAIYSQDLELFEDILEKYQIKWLLLDESIFSPGSSSDVLFFDEIKSLFDLSSKVELGKDFGDGLLVYEVKDVYEHKRVVIDYIFGDSYFNKESVDTIYSNFGDYVNSPNDVFPFIGITNSDESLKLNIVGSSRSRTYLSLGTSGVFERSIVVLEAYLRSMNGNYFLDIYDVSDKQNQFTVPINLSSPSYISLNSEVFIVDRRLVNQALGRVYLDANNSLEVRLFNKDQSTLLTNIGDLSVLESCSSIGEGSAYSWELKKGGFELFAQGVNACVTIPLTRAINPDDIETQSIINISTDYVGSDVPGDICLLNISSNVCEGRYETVPGSLEVISQINKEDLGNYYLRFTTKGRNLEETSVDYSNIKISLLNPYFTRAYSYTDSSATVTPFNDLLSFEKLLEYGPVDLKTYSDPSYCSSGSSVEDEVTYKESGVRYESGKQFICDSISLKSLDSSLAYIVEVQSKNVSGLPMRMCILNKTTDRCDKYISLPKSKEFTESYYLVPPGVVGGKYSLNLVNMFFGEGKFVNEISHISFTPVPYDFLKNLHNDVEKGTGSLLVLNESYDSGWSAFCGLRTCNGQHVRVNNWANGWVLDDVDKAEKAWVIYWPQILQYVGLIFIPAVFVFIVRTKRNW